MTNAVLAAFNAIRRATCSSLEPLLKRLTEGRRFIAPEVKRITGMARAVQMERTTHQADWEAPAWFNKIAWDG